MGMIAQGLVTDESHPRLLGGRNRHTGRIVFPCPPGQDFEPVPLSREGKLWSYTIQRYRPKTPPYAGPEDFEPFVVAYVELAGETIVEARLANLNFDEVHIGMDLELTLIPLDPKADDPVLIHAFQPKGRS